MHTIVVIAAGFVLLGICLLIANATAPADVTKRSRRVYAACKIFILLWLVGAAINLWVGVSQAGYSVAEELPVFVLIFGLPAAVAAIIGRRAMVVA
jgi:cytochrome bd-type quinol oxidase subunit 2